MMLVVTVVGLVMMSRFGGPTGGVFGPFVIIWVVIGLVGASMAFYNAFSKEGLPLYEVDVEEEEQEETRRHDEAGPYCPQCGQLVGEGDQFCRHCGAPLD
jgi:hypothetical protein